MSIASDAAARPLLALFLPTLGGGGAERVTLNLARAFVERGHPVDLVVNRADGALRDSIPAGARLVVLDAPKLPLLVVRLALYLRRAAPHRLFAALDEANIAAVCAGLLVGQREAILCAIHNTLSSRLTLDSSLRAKAILALARLSYPWAGALVAVSEAAAADAVTVLRLRRRPTVIANPVLTPEISLRAAEQVDHSWLRCKARPVLLACGRLTAEKGYPTLLRAFAQVRKADPARLIILGEGQERDGLQDLAVALGIADDVDFPGFVANPYAFMARCAVFVLSSRFEGSPLVLVEALECGCRIVATDCPSGGAREILTNVPGTTLVPVGAPTALAQAIQAFLASTAALPGPRHLARFDYHAAAEAYLAAFPKAAGRSRTVAASPG